MSRNKSKKLKKIYENDEEASQFMKDYPELFGWDAESTHDKPGNNQWATLEPDPYKLAKTDWIMKGLHSLPKSRNRTALEMYYDGRPIEEIQAFLKHKKRHSTVKLIWKMKVRVVKHLEAKKPNKLYMRIRHIMAKTTFTWNGESKAVFLTYLPRHDTYTWTDTSFRAFPDDVQDYLDEMYMLHGCFEAVTEFDKIELDEFSTE